MLKLLIYEMKKVFCNSYIRRSIFILFAINIVLCKIYSMPNASELPTDIIVSFFDTYNENNEIVEQEYAEYSNWEHLQLQLQEEQLLLGNRNFKPEPFNNKYAPEGYSDGQLYRKLFLQKSYITSYKTSINKVISDASALLDGYLAMGFQPSSFPCQYQTEVINRYEALLTNVRLGFEYVHGWDKYFSNEPTIILIFLTVTIISVIMALYDNSCGISQILRVTKKGRAQIFFIKYAAVALITMLITCIFMLSTWCIIGLTEGYSNPFNNIQIIQNFLYCPYNITIISCFFMDLLLKMFAFITFSAFILMISMLCRNYVFAFFAGIGSLSVSFYFKSFPSSYLKYLNIYNIASTDIFFERYNAVNCFTFALNAVLFCVFSYFVIFTAMGIVITNFCSRLHCNTVSISLIPPLIKRTTVSVKSQRKQSIYPLSLLYHESMKLILQKAVLFSVILLLAIKCLFSYYAFQPSNSYADHVYHEYMEQLKGELTQDKLDFIISERNRINNALSSFEDMQQAYLRDEIDFDTYSSFLSEYNYAYSRNELFTVIEEHSEYLDNIEKIGETAWFLYDTGWKKLLFSGFDWTLYAVLIILISGTFVVEFDKKSSSGSFSNILRSTKHGRNKTFIKKLILMLISTILCTVLWNSIDYINIDLSYNLREFSAPIWSIESMNVFANNITIGQYLVVMYVTKILAGICLGTLVYSLSSILKRYISVMPALVSITLIPSLFAGIGMSMFKKVDFTLFFRAVPAFLGNSYGIVYIYGCFILCVAITFFARRLWVK